MKKKIIIKNGARTREPHNKHEKTCYDIMERSGYTVIKSGYPDLFCFRDDGIVLIEVKPRGGDRLKTNQNIILNLLSRHGVPCYKWSPDIGFEKIGN